MKRHIVYGTVCACILAAGLFAFITWCSVRPVTDSFHSLISDAQTLQITDKNDIPLNVSYQNRWNSFDNIALYTIPDFLKDAFIFSEDKRFYAHNGVDWRARLAATWQNLKSGHAVRGASTITEQVVRLIHPRPRTLWSKWIEGFEAAGLERRFSKPDILEFYFNQVPYASNRRGVLQASRFYFNRDITTLSEKEMLALVVLARAPSSYNLYKNQSSIDATIKRLAAQMAASGLISSEDAEQIKAQTIDLEPAQSLPSTAHFMAYVRQQQQTSNTKIKTSLDIGLQEIVQSTLDERLKALSHKNVRNAAALVVDHEDGSILSYVIAGAGYSDTPYGDIDAIRTARQPGSALKPFLYASALEKGWTAATIINDTPLSEAIGGGLHNFKNYSNTYYGKISLREALANSLNIPALRTIRFVGIEDYLYHLHKAGFASLDRGADVYDEGLALGNGEVTLFEIVQAYAALANGGMFRPLHVTALRQHTKPQRLFSEEASSLIGNILSDPWARRLEFSSNSVLNFPVQTAVKTGTSNDYHDAWAVGYNHRYVVGIWMGNLDRAPTDGVTGSTGPALALRGIFSALNRNSTTRPLFLSSKLVKTDICLPENMPDCTIRSEFFISGTEAISVKKSHQSAHVELVRPTEGLQIAFDPRIPRHRQKFEFMISGLPKDSQISWLLNGYEIARGSAAKYLWPVERGKYVLQARILSKEREDRILAPVSFTVK